MSKQNAPFVIRWRNGVMDDPNPALTWRAIVAAMALTRYADVKTGHNCYPGKAACAAKMRVSEDTIQRGWAELVHAGWLKIHPLPEERRRRQGALKELRFPRRDMAADSTRSLSAPHPVADSGTTIPGNREPYGPAALQAGTGGESGPPEGWTAAEEREARAMGLVCSRCDSVVAWFPPQAPGSTLCRGCLDGSDE